MEIKEYKKLKSNIYEIKFKSGEAVKLYDEVILNYNLLITKNISNKEYEEIIKYNKSLDAYYLSLKYSISERICLCLLRTFSATSILCFLPEEFSLRRMFFVRNIYSCFL